MNNILYSIVGIMIPFVGTSLGSGFVFFLKNKINEKIQKLLIGIAAGVMISASIWSLILPAVEMAEKQGVVAWIPATVGFILGVLFLLITSHYAEKLEVKRNGKKMNMLLFSVTLHNIPEGMAVGVCFAGFLASNVGIDLLEATAPIGAFTPETTKPILYKLGIQASEGTIVKINNVSIKIGKTGIYELDNIVDVKTLVFPNGADENTIIDFVY